jgi:hypothetical protein
MRQKLEEPKQVSIMKISHKLSLEEFLQSLTSGTQKIIISNSILEHSKNIRLFIHALHELYNLPVLPEIEIVERGKKPRVLKQDWIDPFIRTLIGNEQSSESSLRVKLFDLGATSKKSGLQISEFNKNELKLILKLRDKEHIIASEDLKIFLTPIGITLAKGAKKIFE